MLSNVIGMCCGNIKWSGRYFFEKNVQDRVVELGLTTKEKIKRDYAIAGICLFIPLLIFVPLMVYFVNGARGFKDLFIQICIILMIDGKR